MKRAGESKFYLRIPVDLTSEDILADDWEIKTEKVKKKLWMAISCIQKNSGLGLYHSTSNAYVTRADVGALVKGDQIIEVEIEVEE